MEVFEFTCKSKVKRIFEGVKESLDRNKCVRVIGKGDGSIKAVAVAEKLKADFENLDQVNEILVEGEEIGIKIELRLI